MVCEKPAVGKSWEEDVQVEGAVWEDPQAGRSRACSGTESPAVSGAQGATEPASECNPGRHRPQERPAMSLLGAGSHA